MPLAGAVVADSYWGRYRTMVVSCSVGVAVSYLIALATTLQSAPQVLSQSSNITP
jgi:peptide/histidine transporter 3/4